MSSYLQRWSIGLVMGAIACGLLGSQAAVAQPPELRYGFETDKSYLYDVKIIGEISTRKSTSSGILTYRAEKTSDTQFTIVPTGMLSRRWESTGDSHGGPFPHFIPPMGFPPFISADGGTTFTRTGTMISTKSDRHLPFVLGRLDELVIEPFSKTPQTSWTTSMDVAVVERMSAGSFFMRLHSFRDETRTIAKEVIKYEIVGREGDVVQIRKNYSMKTLPDEGIVRFDMAGDGEFKFDTKKGRHPFPIGQI